MCEVYVTQANISIMTNYQENILFLESFLGSLRGVFKLLLYSGTCSETEWNLFRTRS